MPLGNLQGGAGRLLPCFGRATEGAATPGSAWRGVPGQAGAAPAAFSGAASPPRVPAVGLRQPERWQWGRASAGS